MRGIAQQRTLRTGRTPRGALVAAPLLLWSAGCDFPSGARPEGVRFLTGAVAIPDEDLAGRQNTGLQVAAIAIGTAEDADDMDAFTSAVFDASRVENTRFSVTVADDRSFVVVLQVPSAATSGFGTLLAQLAFDDGLGGSAALVPPGEADVELATLTVSAAPSAAARRLVPGEASNPLIQVDTDGDGTSDLTDQDDDDDGTLDAADEDVGGDGVADAAQVLTSLPDDNGDGVPDLLEG